MRGKAETLELMTYAVNEAQKMGMEVLVNWLSYHESTMRSGWGEVIQTPAADAGMLSMDVRQGQKSITKSLVQCDRQSIRYALKKAKEELPEVPDNPYLPDLLPQPRSLIEEEMQLQELPHFSADLATKERAFTKIATEGNGTNLVGSARFFTAACEIGVANSRGLLRYHTASYAFLSLVVTGPNGISSYADRVAPLPENVDINSAINEAFERAALCQRLPLVDPFSDGKGERKFDVVFNHYAVGDWLWWLSLYSFNGLSVHEKQSYLSGKNVGDLVTGENVSFVDNWAHQDVIPLPFDLEGADRSILILLS